MINGDGIIFKAHSHSTAFVELHVSFKGVYNCECRLSSLTVNVTPLRTPQLLYSLASWYLLCRWLWNSSGALMGSWVHLKCGKCAEIQCSVLLDAMHVLEPEASILLGKYYWMGVHYSWTRLLRAWDWNARYNIH